MQQLLKDIGTIAKSLVFNIFPTIQSADLGIIGDIGTVIAISGAIIAIIKYIKDRI